MTPGCTCGATLKHSADCVIFWAPLPREMVLDDICPATMEYPRGVWHRTWPASQWDFDRAFK